MAVPASIEARLYYRCAFQRFEDAQILLRAAHTTDAVYLAGYSVECILKAILLEQRSPATRADLLTLFRGNRAHDYEWLRARYLEDGGARFPRDLTAAFTLVSAWSTDMRYLPRTLRAGEAKEFLAAAESILRALDGRL
jgi:HEPN domain-containing protein